MERFKELLGDKINRKVPRVLSETEKPGLNLS